MENRPEEVGPVPSAFHTILFGGLAVGVLDAIAATVNAGIRGVGPARVWQYVASSILGSESFNGGTTTAMVGLLFHFGVSFGVATVFYVLTRIFPALLRYALIVGPLYGIAVYFAMTYLIVPLTAVKQGQFSWSGLITGCIIHMLFVGLPVGLIAKRYAR